MQNKEVIRLQMYFFEILKINFLKIHQPQTIRKFVATSTNLRRRQSFHVFLVTKV